MRTLLLNDTRDYHKGCEKVIEAIDQIYGFDDSIKTRERQIDLENLDYSKYDRVILNGEGTMHHDSRRAKEYLIALKYAQKTNCETYIINSVWQEMTHDFDSILQKCDFISVREKYSKEEISKHGIDAKIIPDLSYFVDVPLESYSYEKIYEGQYIKAAQNLTIGKYPRIDIFKQDWNEIVNRLRNSDLLITGRHHEMYAACKAKCKFIVKDGNTWKNKGLLVSADVNIPDDIDGVLGGKYDDQYEKLWDYLEQSTYSR